MILPIIGNKKLILQSVLRSHHSAPARENQQSFSRQFGQSGQAVGQLVQQSGQADPHIAGVGRGLVVVEGVWGRERSESYSIVPLLTWEWRPA